MHKAILLALGLGLAACAPTLTRDTLSSDAPFTPTGQESMAICTAQPRVAEHGVLLWDDGPVVSSHQAPYLLACPGFTLKNDGATLTVQDSTVSKALTHFDPDAYFLSYYADLFVRFPADGVVSADSTAEVPEVLMDAVRRITVTASQGGTPERTLLKGATVTPVHYDPAQPLTLRLRGDRAIAWPEVTLEASTGVITAPIFR